MKINFIFCRHGYGCHNAIMPLYKNNLLTPDNAKKFQKRISFIEKENEDLFIDPELTQIGVDASAYNGCIVSKTIRDIGFEIFKTDEFSSINIVGCSPLIRSMETAYYMTKSWTTKPDKIYVFPYLREINESSGNKYSKESRIIMDTTPSYAMKNIDEQRKYLKTQGLDEIIDFTYVQKNMKGRREAGDIMKFVEWFLLNIVKNIEPVDRLNVFIITHAGVLMDFIESNDISEKDAKRGFVNNSGFIMSLREKDNNIEVNQFVSLNDFLPDTFFRDYSNEKYSKGQYYCPSKRCSNFCKYVKHDEKANIDNINLPKCENKDENNLSSSSKLNIKK